MNLRHLAQQIWLAMSTRSSDDYWKRRYDAGLTSGTGSYGQLATYKAEVLNEFVSRHNIQSVIEFGCGDGNQLELAQYPRYLGLDISPKAIELCAHRFRQDQTKSFLCIDARRTANLAGYISADLTLSLDVVYHLLEDSTYEHYLTDVFTTARRYVVIYSSDMEQPNWARHVRHRRFTQDVARLFPAFRLIERLENPLKGETFADFHFYQRTG